MTERYRYRLELPIINGVMSFSETGFERLPRVRIKWEDGEYITMVIVQPKTASPVFVLIPEREIKDLKNERH